MSFRCNSELDFIASLKHHNFYFLQSAKFRSEQISKALIANQYVAPYKRTQHCWPTTPNIVRCYMLGPFAHPVACCWMLLRVVAQRLKPVKLFSQRLPTFLMFRDRSLPMVYKDLWVVSFPRCTAGPNIVWSFCIRLHSIHCQHARNNSQHRWRDNVGSCCVRLHEA